MNFNELEFNDLLKNYREAAALHTSLSEKQAALCVDDDNWDSSFNNLCYAEHKRDHAAISLSRFIAEHADQIRFE